MSHHNVIQGAGLVGSGASVSGGLFLWFGEHATAIGAIVTLATFIMTAVFLILNAYINYQRLKFEKRREGDKQ